MSGYPDTLQYLSGGPGEPGPQGPQGPQGEQGPKGDPGLSAYEVALANGFVGTEEEWLASLVGPQGEPGSGGGLTPGSLELGPGLTASPGIEPGTVKVSVTSTFPFFDTNGSSSAFPLNP